MILCIIELAIVFASCSHFAESKHDVPYVTKTAVSYKDALPISCIKRK
jgi:hypothetical protein